jgi:DNA polymerase III epsilon subunit-like protein
MDPVRFDPDLLMSLDDFVWHDSSKRRKMVRDTHDSDGQSKATSTTSVDCDVADIDSPLMVEDRQCPRDVVRPSPRPCPVFDSGTRLPPPQKDRCLIFYDLETTDINSGVARIVQIAALAIHTGAVENPAWERTVTMDQEMAPGCSSVRVRTFLSYVNPGMAIPTAAREIHGIDDDRVAGAPVFRDLLPEFAKFCSANLSETSTGVVFVGHNSWRYDDVVISRETERNFGLTFPAYLKGTVSHRIFDIMSCDTLIACQAATRAKELAVPDHKLGTLFQQLTGQTMKGAHDALVDTAAVLAISRCPVVQKHLRRKVFGSKSK